MMRILRRLSVGSAFVIWVVSASPAFAIDKADWVELPGITTAVLALVAQPQMDGRGRSQTQLLSIATYTDENGHPTTESWWLATRSAIGNLAKPFPQRIYITVRCIEPEVGSRNPGHCYAAQRQ